MAAVNLAAEEFEKLAMDAYLRDSSLQREAERQNKKIGDSPRYVAGITSNQLSHYIYNFKEYVYRRLCQKFSRLKNYSPAQLLTHRIEYTETDLANFKKRSVNGNAITYAYVILDFNTDVLHYPSLNPNNPGVNNIILLLTKGWDYSGKKRPPFGMWHDSQITGWTKRNPNDFLETIIEDYNELRLADTRMRASLFSGYTAFGAGVESINDIIGYTEKY